MRFLHVSFLASATLLATVSPAQYPLTIVNTSNSFGIGAVGQAYSSALVAIGGTQPYTWSVTGLPPGLVVNSEGIISGTPTTGGTYSFTLKVVDASNFSVSKALSILITGSGPPPPPTPPPLTVKTTTFPS